MKKSAALNLREISFGDLSDDYDYGNLSDDNFDDSFSDGSEDRRHQTFSATIQQQLSQFMIQNFEKSTASNLPQISDDEYDICQIDSLFHPTSDSAPVPIECMFMMIAGSNRFPRHLSKYYTLHPAIYMWRDVRSVMETEFTEYAKNYFKEHYTNIKKKLRFFNQIDPTVDKLNNVMTLRRDIPNGRIIYHYIGYGFPTMKDSTIPCIDKKTGNYISYPLKSLFESIKPPSLFIFDCSNAASAIQALENATLTNKSSPIDQIKLKEQFMTRNIDWNDWFCFCATDVNEQLPSDPHLPNDFLTSCIFTPIRMAIICHILQFYRTSSIVTNSFPLDRCQKNIAHSEDSLLENTERKKYDPLFDTNSQINKSLEHVLSAIIDAIAVESIPGYLYNELFTRDHFIALLYKRLLLAQYLLRPYQIHPVSRPAIPDLSTHPLWQHWKMIVDIAVTTPNCTPDMFSTKLFARSTESVIGFLKRNQESEIPPSLIALMFKFPVNNCYMPTVYSTLAQYAATSEDARVILSKTADFLSLFSMLISKDIPEKTDIFKASSNIESHSQFCIRKSPTILKSDSIQYQIKLNEKIGAKTIHNLCYLIIALIQHNPKFIDDVKKLDFGDVPFHIFNQKLPSQTRVLIAVIVSALVSFNESIRSIVVSKTFLNNAKKELETSDTLMSLWLIMVIRRMFDSYGYDMNMIYSIALHIQIATFVYHNSFEVRAAAVSALSLMIQQEEENVNRQLFCLIFPAAFDPSYLVRYHFLIFIGRLISYHRSSPNSTPDKTIDFMHQSFSSLIFQLFYREGQFENKPFTFNFISSLASSDYPNEKIIWIRNKLVSLLLDDPHVSVKAAAQFVQSLLTQSLRSPNDIIYQPGIIEDNLSSNNSNSQFFNNIIEKGGDGIFKIFINQIVNSGMWCLKDNDESKQSPASLPQASLSLNTQTKISSQIRFKVEWGQPIKIAYHATSLSFSVATSNGVVSFVDERNGRSATAACDSQISSLCIGDWGFEPLVLYGTNDGCVSLWNPKQHTPKMTLRADWPSSKKGALPLVLSIVNGNNQIVTSRGNCGIVRLWDIEYEKLIAEYSAGAHEAVTAIVMHPTNSDICVSGFQNGLIVELDLRGSNDRRLQNVAAPRANEEILKIVGNIGSSYPNISSFIAATKKGSCFKWERLEDYTVMSLSESSPLTDFDAHLHSPLMVFSPKFSPPIMTDFNGNVIHSLKNIGSNAICSFHPVLPVISFGTPSGEIVEVQLTA